MRTYRRGAGGSVTHRQAREREREQLEISNHFYAPSRECLLRWPLVIYEEPEKWIAKVLTHDTRERRASQMRGMYSYRSLGHSLSLFLSLLHSWTNGGSMLEMQLECITSTLERCLSILFFSKENSQRMFARRAFTDTQTLTEEISFHRSSAKKKKKRIIFIPLRHHHTYPGAFSGELAMHPLDEWCKLNITLTPSSRECEESDRLCSPLHQVLPLSSSPSTVHVCVK